MQMFYLTFGTGALNHYVFTTLEKAQAAYAKLRADTCAASNHTTPFAGWIEASGNQGFWQIADYSKPGWAHDGFQFECPDDVNGLLQGPHIWSIEVNPTDLQTN